MAPLGQTIQQFVFEGIIIKKKQKTHVAMLFICQMEEGT